jgi:vacuolar-type H+-ATPase subunit H
MNLGKWKLFSAYHHVYASEAYNETMRATEQLARDSLLLLDRKPEEERREILAKAESLTERISETLESEAPMVASLGLLTAIRVLERMIKDQAAALRRGTKSRGL